MFIFTAWRRGVDEELKAVSDKLNNVAPCADCHGIFIKSSLHPVESIVNWPFSKDTFYYCKAHTKPYDKVQKIYSMGGGAKTYYSKNIAAKTVAVDVDGKEIK